MLLKTQDSHRLSLSSTCYFHQYFSIRILGFNLILLRLTESSYSWVNLLQLCKSGELRYANRKLLEEHSRYPWLEFISGQSPLRYEVLEQRVSLGAAGQRKQWSFSVDTREGGRCSKTNEDNDIALIIILQYKLANVLFLLFSY